MPSERSVRHRAKRLGYHVTKSRERKHVPHNRFCYIFQTCMVSLTQHDQVARAGLFQCDKAFSFSALPQ